MITYKPIAVFCSSHKETYEAPRQGVLADEACGYFELSSDFSKDAIDDLVGFERIWLIYDFHKNKTWKPKVRPPRFSDQKRSVFSTRSPYRPNSIGMSCVKLEKVEGKTVFVSGHDLLEGSLILDIKPYLPYADSFPDAQTGWVKLEEAYEVSFNHESFKKLFWLEEQTGLSFRQILSNQLAYEPFNSKAKRVASQDKHFVFSIRTWRFAFKEIKSKKLEIFEVYSGYSDEDLKKNYDPYEDLSTHKAFKEQFT